ncbi:MAG: D-alanyl-D-alanine carboxypeptidase [Thermodesulfovibrionales bacterium]|nr:D-alanyl-D-alanine carboxypeptidase [Thermodesulfovibrionales bacterium]
MGRFCFVILLVCMVFLFVPSYVSANAKDVSAKGAVAIDVSNDRILYAKNPHYKQPPASTTKLVTAMVVLDKLPLNKVVRVSDTAAQTPTVSPRIREGEHFTVEDLLYMLLMRSINSAAVVLAEAVSGSEEEFVKLMNQKALSIDAENTRFANASGLPGGEQYITAYDLAKILKESLKYPQIREIINTKAKHIRSEEGRKIFLKNTNQLLWADEGVIGGKTGYTKAAQHCFVNAGKKADTTIVVALLGENVRDNLWQDTDFLLKFGEDVLLGKTEPVMFFTNTNDSPAILAAYKKQDADKKINKKTKKSAKSSQNKNVKKSKKTDKGSSKYLKQKQGTKNKNTVSIERSSFTRS